MRLGTARFDAIYLRWERNAAENTNEQTSLFLVGAARDIRIQARPCHDTNNEHENNPDAEANAEGCLARASSQSSHKP